MRGLLKIITKDPFLGQKLYRELLQDFDRIEIAASASGSADLWICDCRENAPFPKGENVFYLTETAVPHLPQERCLPIPLPLGLAREKLKNRGTPPPLSLIEEEHAIRFYGEYIRLTEVEFSLLRALSQAKGECISREALLRTVWGEMGTNSLLNVYVHYLREKLERGGEKVILSSRGAGYALAKKFLKEGDGEC